MVLLPFRYDLMGDLGSIPCLGRSPGEGKGYPLQCSGLENSMDSMVHGVAALDTTEQLSLQSLSTFNPSGDFLDHVIFDTASRILGVWS